MTPEQKAREIVADCVKRYGAIRAFRDFDCDLVPMLRAAITAALAAERERADGLTKLIREKCEHIIACADVWEKSGVSRVRTVTRTAEEIAAAIRAQDSTGRDER